MNQLPFGPFLASSLDIFAVVATHDLLDRGDSQTAPPADSSSSDMVFGVLGVHDSHLTAADRARNPPVGILSQLQPLDDFGFAGHLVARISTMMEGPSARAVVSCSGVVRRIHSGPSS